MVQFYSWFKFYFPFCVVMYDNEFETKKTKLIKLSSPYSKLERIEKKWLPVYVSRRILDFEVCILAAAVEKWNALGV